MCDCIVFTNCLSVCHFYHLQTFFKCKKHAAKREKNKVQVKQSSNLSRTQDVCFGWQCSHKPCVSHANTIQFCMRFLTPCTTTHTCFGLGAKRATAGSYLCECTETAGQLCQHTALLSLHRRDLLWALGFPQRDVSPPPLPSQSTITTRPLDLKTQTDELKQHGHHVG